VSNTDPSEVVEGILSSGRNVRFGRGVVSKTSYVAAIIAIAWIVLLWRWTDNLKADAGLLIAGFVVTLFGVWFIRGTQRFAERNPAQALLEGAELLEWHKAEIQAKGLPPSDSPPMLEVTPNPPRKLRGK
jgi:hypothetical protein